ncbi:serine/threonine-protein kinase ATR-like [Tachypleus tridentatus]|uniref:serine/threonine-protein kinase ATR-like n=1 Tax=Tachypleus tridentatus TaxID=6853 RepID=UPI003FD2A1D6
MGITEERTFHTSIMLAIGAEASGSTSCHRKPVQHQASTSRLSTKRKRASDDIKGEEPLKFQENTCRNSSWKSPGMNAVDKKICELTEKACEKMKTESTLRYMLPPLATKASPEASMLLKVLAKQMRIQKQELLMNHFKYIFSYLVRHCSKEEMEKALTYVQTETNIEIGSLLRCDYQRIHNELLLHISTHYEQVFSGLAMLAWKDESYDGTKPITKPEDIAKFLQPRLLGFLAFFDSQLLNANFPLEEKKLALGSLNSIMELMGPKHITAVRMKVMATLKIAIHFTEEDFPQICTQAWNTFVHNVELQSLGSLLNQVMTALLPLLQFHPQGVATIFHFFSC